MVESISKLRLVRDAVYPPWWCLQEEVLTPYHLSNVALEVGPATKSVMSSNGRLWVKNT